MFKRRYAALLPALILLSACSSKPKTEAVQQTAGAPSGGFLLEPQHNMMQMGGDFANNPAAEQFIDKMVSKHALTDSSCTKFCLRPGVWTTCCA